MDHITDIFKHPKLQSVHDYVYSCELQSTGLGFVFISLIFSAVLFAQFSLEALDDEWNDWGEV
jgi:hypothetical protein